MRAAELKEEGLIYPTYIICWEPVGHYLVYLNMELTTFWLRTDEIKALQWSGRETGLNTYVKQVNGWEGKFNYRK